jgi:hypothetical protein
MLQNIFLLVVKCFLYSRQSRTGEKFMNYHCDIYSILNTSPDPGQYLQFFFPSGRANSCSPGNIAGSATVSFPLVVRIYAGRVDCQGLSQRGTSVSQVSLCSTKSFTSAASRPMP